MVLDRNDPSNAATMAVCVMAMLISLTFAWRYWTAWLVAAGITQASTTDTNQSTTSNQINSRGSSNGHNGSTRGTPLQRSLQSLLPRPSSLKSKLVLLGSIKFKRIPLLPTLLLVTWSIYTFDQLMMLLMAIALIYTCPQYNCKETILPIEPPDCTSINYFSALIYLQTLGSCTFVLCVLYRFISAFAVISRKRSMVLRVTCALVILITLYRLIGVAIIDIKNMTGWPPGNDGLVMAYSLNSSSYRAFYIMLGVSCISGLSLGLQYVKRVRAQARDAGISSLIMPTVSPSTHDAAESCIEPPASDLLPAASASTGVMLNTRTAHGGGTTGAGVAQKHIRKHKRNVQNRIKQSWFVVFWILVALGTVVGFAVIMLSSLSYDMPPLFLNAFMTLFLKVFSGSVCLSIASMTRLVSASASSAGTSGQGMPVNDASMGTVL